MDSPDRTLTRIAAALSAGAGLIHVGLAGAHAEHHWTMGVAFLLAGVAQLAGAGALLLRPARRVVAAGAAVQLACVAGLVLVSTVGWPVGPQAWQPEQVSTAAVVCVGLELAATAAAAALVLGRVRLPSLALPVALVAVVASSSGALAVGAGHPAGHATGHADSHATAAALGAHQDGDGHDAEQHAGAEHTGAEYPGAEPAGTEHPGSDGPAGTDHPHATEGTTSDAATLPAAETGAETGGHGGETGGHGGETGGHGHGPVDTTPPTAAQQAAADELLRASRATMRRYDLASVAEADGYRVVHDAGGRLLHYLHDGYARDGRDLDPQRIESLLYVVLPGGGKLLVGGMFTVPKGQRGEAVGGSLTQWHAHDDLCLDPARGIAITQQPGGGCPPGSAVGTTGEMMHVWALDYPGGPFGELDPIALRQAVLAVYGIDGQV